MEEAKFCRDACTLTNHHIAVHLSYHAGLHFQHLDFFNLNLIAKRYKCYTPQMSPRCLGHYDFDGANLALYVHTHIPSEARI